MKKLPVAIATIFLAASTALPAFAATPRAAVEAPMIAAQHRPMPQQRVQTNGDAHRSAYGSTCVDRSDSGQYSAFPSWDVCG